MGEEQDFYSQILLFNMIEDLKNGANKELQVNNTKDLKCDYKVNINILVGTFRECMIKIAIEDRPDERKLLFEYIKILSKYDLTLTLPSTWPFSLLLKQLVTLI